MGDRANVAIKQPDGTAVYLYTHWGGSELALTVQKALAKRWRWDDGAYLARIVFDAMSDGNHGNETGFGISTGICDNEHPIVVLDPRGLKVGFAKESAPLDAVVSWTFVEYCALAAGELEKAYRKVKWH